MSYNKNDRSELYKNMTRKDEPKGTNLDRANEPLHEHLTKKMSEQLEEKMVM